jgi:thymidylate kinase
MIVILEGVDGTFKSTIAFGLSNHIGLPVVPGSSFESAKLSNKELFRWYLEKIAGGQSVIFDRFVYSNRVYAQSFQDYSLITLPQMRLLEQVMGQMHDYLLVVYLTGTEDDIRERINIRGDNYIKVNKVKGLITRYEDIMKKEVGLKIIVVNTSRMTSEESINFLSKKIRRETENSGFN